MNGIHDMGGMQDMGPIRCRKERAGVPRRWEGRVYAI